MDIYTTAGAIEAVLACRLQQFRHILHTRIVRIRTRDAVTLPAFISEHVSLVLQPLTRYYKILLRCFNYYNTLLR